MSKTVFFILLSLLFMACIVEIWRFFRRFESFRLNGIMLLLKASFSIISCVVVTLEIFSWNAFYYLYFGAYEDTDNDELKRLSNYQLANISLVIVGGFIFLVTFWLMTQNEVGRSVTFYHMVKLFRRETRNREVESLLKTTLTD